MPTAREVQEIGRRLGSTRFRDVRWVSETGSTNADVTELIRAGEPEGITLVADHQASGRGRRGRTWDMPERAGLLATVLLRPPARVAALTTMALALSASDAVADLCGVQSRLKWPNDLVWPGDSSAPDRKLAGILAEAEWPAGSSVASGWCPPEQSQRVGVAAGIGINVAWGTSMPAELSETAVALDHIVSPDLVPSRPDLLVALLSRLDEHYGMLVADGGGARLLELWRGRSATLGRRVRVELGSEDVEGTAVDITSEGHLVVEDLDGTRRTLAVGDVVHLRPTS